MKKNKFLPFLYFLLISVAIILSFNLFTISYIKKTYSIPSPLFELELDPNWNISRENGETVFSGSGVGFARIPLERVGEIKIKEDLKKQIFPSVIEKIKKIEFRMKVEKGGMNLNLESIGHEGIYRRYLVNFYQNVDITKREGENVLLHKTFPLNLSFDRWYKVKVWVENRTIYLKVNNFTRVSFYDPNPYRINRISFETWEGSKAKISDIKVEVKKKEIFKLMYEDLTVLGRICGYLFFFLAIFFLLFKVNARYATWFFLGCLAALAAERPTLPFSQQLFSEGFLIGFSLYTFPFLIISSYLLRKGFRDFYSLLLGGLITHLLIDFSLNVVRMNIVGLSLMIFVGPLLLIDKYISKRPIITFQKRIYDIFTNRRKFYLLLFFVFIIYWGYSEMGLAISPLPFYLSVIALFAEFTLLYLMFSFLSDSPITSLSISEILPNRKEWKILTASFLPIYFLILAFFVWKVSEDLPLSTIIALMGINLLAIPFLIILLKRCKKKHMKTVNIELKKYANRKHFLIFLCLASLPFFFLAPVSAALGILTTLIVLFFVLVDILR
ncbi:MAG: hypothetical protein B6U78_00990 [Candidatus Aenigmarchaeota archaeon ex4484_224]|nr:MAG: hypothetical protein B6U78_00990 [Candidatus Aenigmarchaeota archaeon ex4484_224]